MERLQKVIAQSGVTSRRKAENLIVEGKVKVNGKKVTELGTKVSADDIIEINGVPLHQETLVYYLLYKPRGIISAVSDDRGRKVVTDLLPGVFERIYPVGRLDYDASGLLILTNDGAFANKLTHPKHEIKKTYIAKVKGVPTTKELDPLSSGLKVAGKMTAPANVSILSTDFQKNTAIISLTIHEGRNHQVKNMLATVGFPVIKLKRERYGSLDLTGLKPGQYREISKREVEELLSLAL